jgi:Mg-chelatase subunit ChlD
MFSPVVLSHPWYLLCLLALGPIVWLWWRGRTPPWRWGEGIGLALRVSIVVLLVLGLAGLQRVQASDDLAVVFALDASDSIDPQAREQALSFIRAALAEMGPDDRAALVLFGADVLVEQPMSQARELGELLSIPATSHTDAGKAVRLGLALLPATAQRRLVLLSDGRVNVPGVDVAVQLAVASGVRLSTVPLTARSGDETWVDRVTVPRVLYEGETFSVGVLVQSTVSQPALVRLYAGDALAAEQAVSLHVGRNALVFELAAGEVGFSSFTAQVVPRDDTFTQNNVLGTFAVVKGAPRVLVVARAPYDDEDSGLMVDDAALLVPALERAGLSVERRTPHTMPADLASLGAYASVVLVNVPAPALAPRQMDLLQVTVRDLGRGLVCVGGPESYGVGGYYRTALEEVLPVEMAIRDRTRLPPLALVFAIDRSGSMDAAAAQGGVRKLELAKEAVLRSLELLNPGDQVGVVAFESTAQWVWPMSELDDVDAVQRQVATLRAGGGTDIYAGLSAAVGALEGSEAKLKHVILLTDGGASQEGLDALVARLRDADGTLSTVGVGQDAAPFLRYLAVDGGGRYHLTDNPGTIPQIFVQETTLAQRAYLVEETFYPTLAGRSEIVSGIEAVPVLHGYVATSAKAAATMVLASHWDDPVLAQWRYGLGRAVAWTSDAQGRWARAWVRWEQFPRFWAQTVRWTILDQDVSGLESAVIERDGWAQVVVDVAEQTGGYANDAEVTAHVLAPSLARETLALQQSGPGRYEGRFLPGEEGVYLVRIVAQPQGAPDDPPLTEVTGYVQAYSPEYRAFGTDEGALSRLAEAGGGVLLSDPAAVFARDAGADVARTYTDLWPWLLAAAIGLLPFDVAVRRVVLSAADLRRAVRRVAFWRRRDAVRPTPRTERLSRLMAAKRRAPLPPIAVQEVQEAEEATPMPEEGTGAARPVPDRAEAPRPPAEGETTAARLLAAKRRAQRQDKE